MSVAKGCDSPKQVLHGKVQEHNLNTGRAVEFQCDKGYNLVGEPLVVCIGSNTWSSTFPTCQREKLHEHRNTYMRLHDNMHASSTFNRCEPNKFLPLCLCLFGYLCSTFSSSTWTHHWDSSSVSQQKDQRDRALLSLESQFESEQLTGIDTFLSVTPGCV